MTLPRTLSPHEHKLFTELFTRVRLSIQTIECLHTQIEHDFQEFYSLTGDETFQRAYENIHSVPHPLIHQGLPQ
jgi:hypothetical protein